MADDSKPGPQARLMRSRDFKVVYTNTFRFRVNNNEFAIAFGYQTEIPGQIIIQDEAEVVLAPTTAKFLHMGLQDAIDGFEKQFGTIKLSPQLLEVLAKAKAEAAGKKTKRRSASRQEITVDLALTGHADRAD